MVGGGVNRWLDEKYISRIRLFTVLTLTDLIDRFNNQFGVSNGRLVFWSDDDWLLRYR